MTGGVREPSVSPPGGGDAEPLDLVATLAACRHELDRVRRMRLAGEAGAVDVQAAEARLHLALDAVYGGGSRDTWPSWEPPSVVDVDDLELDGLGGLTLDDLARLDGGSLAEPPQSAGDRIATLLAATDGPLTPAEIAASLDLPASTATVTLRRLHATGRVDRVGRGRYTAAPTARPPSDPVGEPLGRASRQSREVLAKASRPSDVPRTSVGGPEAAS